MTDLQKSQLASALKWVFTLGFGFLIKHGMSQAEATGFMSVVNWESLAGFVGGIGSFVYGWWRNHRHNTDLMVAATTGKTTASDTTEARAAVQAALPAAPAATLIANATAKASVPT